MPDTKKKILLVGDANSIFITHLAHWIKSKKPAYQVDVFAVQQVDESKSHFYDHVIRLDDSSYFRIINRFKGIRRLLLIPLYLLKIKSLKDYDTIHFQFISPLRYALIHLFKYFTTSKIVLSVWGSDMYRLDKWDVAAFKSVCEKADLITFANPSSVDYFKANFKLEKNNQVICRFGLAPLENLSQLHLTKNESKIRLGWNSEKLALTVGYNLSRFQQHLEILEVLKSEVFAKFKDQIQIILPISYAGNAVYKQEVLAALEKLPFEKHVYDAYLEENEIALIRKSTDIMLQLQTTDQFSGSMQEHLYAQNVVVTGSWLPYQPMKDMGIYFVETDQIADLEYLLPSIIDNYQTYSEKCTVNEDKIAQLSKWENVIGSWLELYK